MQIRIHNFVITLDTLVADPNLDPHGSAQNYKLVADPNEYLCG
jgi:hypothetical protein